MLRVVLSTLLFGVAWTASVHALELSQAQRDAVMAAVRDTLKDPESAQFKWPDVPQPEYNQRMITYCGLVNAKNSFGGYVGFEPYIAHVTAAEDGSVVAWVMGNPPGDREDQVAALYKVCGDSGYVF